MQHIFDFVFFLCLVFEHYNIILHSSLPITLFPSLQSEWYSVSNNKFRLKPTRAFFHKPIIAGSSSGVTLERLDSNGLSAEQARAGSWYTLSISLGVIPFTRFTLSRSFGARCFSARMYSAYRQATAFQWRCHGERPSWLTTGAWYNPTQSSHPPIIRVLITLTRLCPPPPQPPRILGPSLFPLIR